MAFRLLYPLTALPLLETFSITLVVLVCRLLVIINRTLVLMVDSISHTPLAVQSTTSTFIHLHIIQVAKISLSEDNDC